MPVFPAPLRALLGGLAGLAFPALCLGCEARVSAAEALCPSCLRSLPRAEPGDASALLTGSAVREAVALWTYDASGTVRRLHHALKYGGRPALGVTLGRQVAVAVREAGLRAEAVVPVPLSAIRFRERGYNQAERLAAGLGEALGLPVEPLLERCQSTRAQAALSSAERRQNVAGAFALAPEAQVEGRRLLLVDDVLTTGATLAAAAVPLAEAGAHVEVAVMGLAGI